MKAPCFLVLFFLAQQFSDFRYQQKVLKSLEDSGCEFVRSETPLSLALGPAFKRVVGVQIGFKKLSQSPERLLRQLPVFGGLISLSINGVDVKDLSALERLGSLDSLALTNVGLEDSQFVHLRNLHRLVNLNVSDNPLTLNGRGLSLLPADCPLKTLCLARTALRAENVAILNRFGGLEVLTLDGTAVDDEALSNLRGLKNLITLEANETRVGDARLKWVTSLGSIVNLLLDKTNVDDEGLKTLTALPGLTFLGVAEDKCTEVGVARLQAANPHVFIERW
jgi:hypothetical protein